MKRDALLSELASDLAAWDFAHTFRIGIDGRTAVGKTTFADDLAEALAGWNRTVIRAGLDGFYNPRRMRYARGRMSAEGYYRDARDNMAVRRLLLDPLEPDGNGRYALASFDLDADRDVVPDMRDAPSGRALDMGSVLLCDGSFLQRRELRDGFDCVIFLRACAETSRKRGTVRDGAEMAEAYERRYLPAYDIYDAEASPQDRADIVIDIEDFDDLHWVRRLQPHG